MEKIEFYPIVYEKMDYKVYVHVRKKPNKDGVYKMYFGKTGLPINERWRKNGKGYRPRKNKGLHFWNAIQKYGWNEGFYHFIIREGLTNNEACSLEKFFIKIYKTNIDKFGYNKTDGGDDGGCNEEVKRILRIKSTGRKHSPETLKLLSKLTSGANNPRAKEIICLNDKKVFTTIKECAEFYNLDRSGINKNIKGAYVSPERRFTTLKVYNLMLKDRYSHEYILNNYNSIIKKYGNYIEHVQNNHPQFGKNNSNATPIIHLNSGKIFDTRIDCAKYFKKDYSGIEKNCNGMYKNVKDKFMKLELYNKMLKDGYSKEHILNNHYILINKYMSIDK